MKRLLPGLLLLLGIVVQSADADYLIIRADFGGVQVPPKGGGAPAVGIQPMGQTPDVHATALVEVSKRYYSRQRLLDYVNTRLSTSTYLFGDDKSIFLYKGPNKNYFTGASGLPTVTNDLKAKKDALKTPTAIQRLELAEWVLARGLSVSFLEKDENTPALPQTMLGEFREQMAELQKQADGAPANVKAALDAYERVHQKMHIPLDPDNVLVNEWKDKLGPGCNVSNSERHYTLLFKGAQSPPQELLTRIIGLERVYEGFYYWFALKGKAMPMPKNRLVVVVLENQREFRDRQATFDAGPLVVDGFLARREQLAIYINEPLDEGYQALAKSNQGLLWAQGWNRGELLRGIRPKAKPVNESDRAQTLALLQRAMEEEGELLAGTHIGVEQLIAVSGLLPRTVPAPQWIQFGIPSCFAASRGALWAGFGGANWQYLLEFKRNTSTMDSPAVALRRVLSDHYFNDAITATAENKPAALLKARCLAWSLSHYLAHRELDGLLQYYKELATLPRELELDEGALLGCFARAFKLEQAGMPGVIDEAKLNRMAEQWVQLISRTVQDKVQDPDLIRIRSELKLEP